MGSLAPNARLARSALEAVPQKEDGQMGEKAAVLPEHSFSQKNSFRVKELKEDRLWLEQASLQFYYNLIWAPLSHCTFLFFCLDITTFNHHSIQC